MNAVESTSAKLRIWRRSWRGRRVEREDIIVVGFRGELKVGGLEGGWVRLEVACGTARRRGRGKERRARSFGDVGWVLVVNWKFMAASFSYAAVKRRCGTLELRLAGLRIQRKCLNPVPGLISKGAKRGTHKEKMKGEKKFSIAENWQS